MVCRRNGKRAVDLATNACKLTEFKAVYPLDTLGAAFAETGRFDEAVSTQRKAIGLLTSVGGERLRDELNTRLQGYLEKKPYRESH